MASRTEESCPWSSARAGVALAALLLAVYLPGLASLPVVDRDEARFAQAARQMLESVSLPPSERDAGPLHAADPESIPVGGLHAGGLAVPMVGERARLAKPPLIYWLQALSGAVFTLGDAHRDAPWMYRVPSVVAALIACLATWRLGVGMGSARAGWLAGLTLGACPIVAWEAHQARTDQVLLACTTVAMLAIARVWSARSRPAASAGRWPWVLWMALGLGVLAKGPIAPMVALLCVGTLSVAARDWRWFLPLRPVMGLAVLVAMIAPWLWAVSSRVGAGVMWGVIVGETLGRSVEAREGHWAPPGYHLLLLPVLLWPASLMMLRSVRLGLSALRRPMRDADAFLIAWALPSWMVFEIVGTKLPHYPLPLYPALALLAMRLAAGAAPDPGRRPGPAPNALGVTVWMLIGGLVLVAAPVALAVYDGSPGVAWWGFGTAIVCAAGVLVSGWHAWAGRPTAAATGGALASGLMAIGVIGFVLPRASSLWVTRSIARAAGDPGGTRIGAVGYQEDSLMYLARGRLDRLAPEAVQPWADANRGALLVLPESVTPPSGAVYLATADGWNYSKGDRVRLRVYRTGERPR